MASSGESYGWHGRIAGVSGLTLAQFDAVAFPEGVPALLPGHARVYSMSWCDGPRSGVADLNGAPHVYASECDDFSGGDGTLFRLSGVISDSLFALELQRQAILIRHHFDEPTDPAEAQSLERLDEILDRELVVDFRSGIRARGEFVPLGPSADPWCCQVLWMVL
jgi:hypothetical protein